MISYRLTTMSSLVLACAITQASADAVGISGVDTPETIGLSVGIGTAFPANPDHTEYYAGSITQGNSVNTFHSSSTGGSPASLAWFKFTSDGVSDIMFDTFGSVATFGFGGFSGRPSTELAVFDASGTLVLKQSRVRNVFDEEPGSVAADPNGFDPVTELPPIGNTLHNTPVNPLNPIARGGTNGATNFEITAIGPAPGYAVTLVDADSPIIWRNNARATSQLAFLNNPAPNPLWDPLHPDHDPDADWDQYPILPAGDYFIAQTGNGRFSGFAPDMIDRTKMVGDIVQNGNPATPDDQIPDDGAGGTVRFGFTTLHPNDGIMVLNARKPGDFDSDVDADADDIDTLFDRVSALAGQGLDVTTGVTLDGLPLDYLIIGPSNWEPEIDLSLNDTMLDLTGNARIDMGDVTMLVHNILGTEFGDANLDGVVDGTDESLVLANFGNPGGWADGDFNGDDVVDQLDLDIVQGNLPLAGDLDGDGFVGIGDLNIVLGNWNQNVPPANPLADPSGDGFVGIDDLNEVLGNWNAGTPPNSNAAIPEPASLVLLALGGLASLQRRR